MHIPRNTTNATCIAAILGAAVIVPTISVKAGERALMAKEVRALFPGRYEARVHGYKLAIDATGYGALVGSAFNRTDKGHWWIKGN